MNVSAFGGIEIRIGKVSLSAARSDFLNPHPALDYSSVKSEHGDSEILPGNRFQFSLDDVFLSVGEIVAEIEISAHRCEKQTAELGRV
jgi:hypothetical protein